MEAALVLPIMALLVFGIIEWGLAIDNTSVAGSASRSGARLASAQYGLATSSGAREAVIVAVGDAIERDVTSLRNAEPMEVWVYRANSGPPSTCGSNCWRLVWDPATERFDDPTGSWGSPVACGTSLDTLGVRVRFRHRFFTRIFGVSRDFTQTTTMRLEPRSIDGC